MLKEEITPADVAEICGVKLQTVYTWKRKGKISFTRSMINGRITMTKDEFKAFYLLHKGKSYQES